MTAAICGWAKRRQNRLELEDFLAKLREVTKRYELRWELDCWGRPRCEWGMLAQFFFPHEGKPWAMSGPCSPVWAVVIQVQGRVRSPPIGGKRILSRLASLMNMRVRKFEEIYHACEKTPGEIYRPEVRRRVLEACGLRDRDDPGPDDEYTLSYREVGE